MSPNLVGPNGEPVGRRTITYRDWIGGENAKRYATREDVVSFHNLALQEQTVPLIRQAVANAFRAYEANRWWRRLGRWLRGLLPIKRQPSREEARRILTDIERKRMEPLHALEQRFPEGDADG